MQVTRTCSIHGHRKHPEDFILIDLASIHRVKYLEYILHNTVGIISELQTSVKMKLLSCQPWKHFSDGLYSASLINVPVGELHLECFDQILYILLGEVVGLKGRVR